jgi:hypothetical protein
MKALRRSVLACAMAMVASCAEPPGDPSAPSESTTTSALTANAIGGSNYNWYQLTGCTREPFGIISNYGTPSVRALVQSQLATMHANGQDRLRIAIYHGRGLGGGTLLDSTGGNLSPAMRTNLTNFLADIRTAGFGEIELGFFPQGINGPTSWSAFSEDIYQENWNLIVNLHPIIAAAGILYRIDLLNEGTPTSGQTVLRQYAQRLWTDYNLVFGHNDTLGFSVIASDVDRISQIPVIYGSTRPFLYDMHFYGGAQTEQQEFLAAHAKMSSLGIHDGWIIGETFYNDATAAAGLQSALTSTGRTVFYLAQWPLTRTSTCADVNVAPPSAFSAFTSHGF